MLVEIPDNLIQLLESKGLSVLQALESALELNEESLQALQEALEKNGYAH
ncbi:hypothetical protein [Helicobacter labacensis]|nr:hypothetical protein [Helicobacter labacensis]